MPPVRPYDAALPGYSPIWMLSISNATRSSASSDVDRQASRCAAGFGDEPAAHGALARTARTDPGPRWLQTPAVLARRDADQHLLHDSAIQRIGVGEHRVEDLQARRDRELHQLGTRVNEDRRAGDAVAVTVNRLGDADRLCQTLSSWRLLAVRLASV
jgi:hypothetical protein